MSDEHGFDKPGCYGFAAVYNAGSEPCQACQAAKDCAIIADGRLDEIGKILDVAGVRSAMRAKRKRKLS